MPLVTAVVPSLYTMLYVLAPQRPTTPLLCVVSAAVTASVKSYVWVPPIATVIVEIVMAVIVVAAQGSVNTIAKSIVFTAPPIPESVLVIL